MSDPNGSNTTAAAAVLCAQKHFEQTNTVTVLGGTGPVGQRIAKLAAPNATRILICSRNLERAEATCELLGRDDNDTEFIATKTSDAAEVEIAIHECDVLFAAGAAGVELATEGWLERHTNVKVAIDLNAVPPVGLNGIAVADKEQNRGEVVCYGAIGVGGLKMKIHKQCIRTLFESNDLTLDTMEIFEIGKLL